MDLTQSTWMVRDLGQAASDVLLLEDDSVIAGGWDGAIKYWSAEGDTIWGIETPNRISCLTIESDKLNAVSSSSEMPAQAAPVPQACSLDDPDCEACQ